MERQHHDLEVADLRRELHDSRIGIAQKETQIDELTAILRAQLQATKKLTWFLKETEKVATRLRSSRRWKLANPIAALRQACGGRQLPGYGHLEKIVAEYSKWAAARPEMTNLDRWLEALDRHMTLPALIEYGKCDRAAKPTEQAESGHLAEFPVSQSPAISIIVPVFNQLRFTRACLASVQDNLEEQDIEVIVVDDCSTDNTREALSSVPGLVYIRNENNLGFVGSCNKGATQARGKYLLFLNNDTLVTPGWLSTLLQTFALESSAGLVGSKLIYPDGRLQEAGGIIWRDGSGWNLGKFKGPDEPEFNFMREVDYCSAASLMIRKSLFEQVEGFDPSFAPGYYEDTDLAFKVRAAGSKVLYQPLSEVIHFEGATGGTDLSAGAKKYQEINRSKFQEKWAEVLTTKPANGDVASWERLGPGCKHILVIDHQVPMPDRDSGSVRMFQILTILGQLGHRVTFIPANLAHNPTYSDELRKRGIEVFMRPHLRDMEQYLQRHGIILDAVVLSRWGTAEKHLPAVRRYAGQSRIIFDTVDLHFVRTAREAKIARTAESINRARATQAQELELIGDVDETWVVSEVERQLLLQDWPDRKIEVVSNIVDVAEPRTSFSGRAGLLFIGSFLHPPNVDAVLFFANEIQPLLAQRIRGFRCYIIGNKPPPEIMALASDAIIVTGPVSDVRSYFESVRLSVAPIRYGAGVKGKINQSMGLGLPVVATSAAVEGMSLTNGEDVLVADDPAQFAECVIEVYNSEGIWTRLSTNGLETTRKLYSPQVARQTLARLFDDDRIAPVLHSASSPLSRR
jgi:O-antigen biosynthesis protein